MTIPLPQCQQIRVARGWARRQLAEAAGVSISTIEAAEGLQQAKRGIGLWVAQRIAAALDVDTGTLCAVDMMSAWAQQRAGMTALLLSYRAGPYHGGGRKKKEADCGDSPG